jgi:hypothetical protein
MSIIQRYNPIQIKGVVPEKKLIRTTIRYSIEGFPGIQLPAHTLISMNGTSYQN